MEPPHPDPLHTNKNNTHDLGKGILGTHNMDGGPENGDKSYKRQKDKTRPWKLLV